MRIQAIGTNLPLIPCHKMEINLATKFSLHAASETKGDGTAESAEKWREIVCNELTVSIIFRSFLLSPSS